MKKSMLVSTTLMLAVLVFLSLGSGAAQGSDSTQGTMAQIGTAFTYQGYLASDDTPVNGRCDFQFNLYDAPSHGQLVAGPLTKLGVSITDGYFTVKLDFRYVFDGTALWLAPAVKCRDDAFYIPLEPLQELTAAPYALYALSADSADSALFADSALTLEPGAIVSGTAGAIVQVENNNDAGGVSAALHAWSTATTGYHYGIMGQTYSDQGVGVYGIAEATTGLTYGVAGKANSPGGYGVFGWSTATGGLAGKFMGHVDITGTLTKGAGSFKIDHPLDPVNKYLSHSFVESPDMLNIYNGNVLLDEDGTAWVELPEWFEALNGGTEHTSEYRYQLTCIGGFAPVYIAQKIEHNRFQIAGGTPGLEISWQVTGIRHDPYAEAHRILVEEDKPVDELGTYRHPGLYGQPEELGVDYQLLNHEEAGAR